MGHRMMGAGHGSHYTEKRIVCRSRLVDVPLYNQYCRLHPSVLGIPFACHLANLMRMPQPPSKSFSIAEQLAQASLRRHRNPSVAHCWSHEHPSFFAAKGTGDELTHVPLTEVFNRKLAWLPKEWNAFSEIVEECSELYTWGSLISHKRKPDDCDRTRSISMISEPQVCFLLGTGQLVRPVPPKSPNLTLAC